MIALYFLALGLLLVVLSLAAYVDRLYSEMGKFLAREYQDNIDAWEQTVEPRFHLARDSVALSASMLRQLSLAAIAFLLGSHLFLRSAMFFPGAWPAAAELARTAAELVLLILIFDRLVPQILFARTRGLWVARIRLPLEVLFYLILPVTLLLGLLLSIIALAEPEDSGETEDSSAEAMDALLEAGEEEGILEESDRELVRSVVEFGDKVVREVMTPRPEIFAVPGSLTLQSFTAAIEEHAFSRVPVYASSLDDVTGIAFAHDLLQVPDTEAGKRTVAAMQRPAAFVPETKNVAELLREMQREKQHMRVVIDEYGSVAGLVTIEDLLEAIVGEIADEHDEPEDEDAPVLETDGSYTLPGTYEISRLRELFREGARNGARESGGPPGTEETPGALTTASGIRSAAGVAVPGSAASRTGEAGLPEEAEFDNASDFVPVPHDEPELPQSHDYEATTVAGLVSEIAGHIPLPGEVVEQDGLRMEVLASTNRRVDRLRVSLVAGSVAE